jgi:hypothetical protein
MWPAGARSLYRREPMQLNPYLMFNGQCEAAFRFYEKALGGKIETDVCRLANG